MLNIINSKIFGITEDFQRAYIVYTHFLRNEINCELINVDRNATLLNSMYDSQRYLGQNVLIPCCGNVQIIFILRVHRKDYSFAEKVYDDLNLYYPARYPEKMDN